MLRTLILLTGTIILLSCQSSTEQNTEKDLSQVESDTIFGASFEVKSPLSSRSLVEQMKGEEMQDIQVKGTIQEVCQKKGCWLTLPLSDTNNIRVRFKNYGFFVPKDIAGEEVVLHGKAYYDTISVDMRKHYARDQGKSEEAIESIDEPKVKLAFTAKGVLLKRDSNQ